MLATVGQWNFYTWKYIKSQVQSATNLRDIAYTYIIPTFFSLYIFNNISIHWNDQ